MKKLDSGVRELLLTETGLFLSILTVRVSFDIDDALRMVCKRIIK
jgi:hypothetical protein